MQLRRNESGTLINGLKCTKLMQEITKLFEISKHNICNKVVIFTDKIWEERLKLKHYKAMYSTMPKICQK